jgi:monoamine oxidase
MDVGFWDLLYDQVGQEGYRYLTEAGGYDSNTINWNSALAMPYVASGDYSSTATYSRVVGGYQTLPLQLAQNIADRLPIQMRTRLAGITRDESSGLLDLTVAKGPMQSVIRSKYVLLCMPKRSLELLDPDTEFSTYLNSALIDSVMLQPSFKLLLLFDTEWWQQVNIRGTGLQPYGPTITDLPLRMIWYFDDVSVQGISGQADSKYWALLASYSDMATEQFWIGFRNPLVPGGGLYGEAIPAPPAMVNMALFQLAQVHGMQIPQPVAAVYKDWAADPFGAGYHAWATHVQPWLKYNVMLNPVTGYNVYVCGEAFSLDQGWVEGALRTAESVLTRYFQLPVYPGIPADYVAVRS